MLAVVLGLAGACWGAPTISGWRPVSPPSLAHTAEFAFDVRGAYENAFDPEQIRVDADVTGPSGRSWTVPAFWMRPCAMRVGAPGDRFARLTLIQIAISGAASPRGKAVRFAFSNAELSNSKTGRRRALPVFTDPDAWRPGAGVTVAAGRGPDGKRALTVTIVPRGKGYPGIRMAPKGALADWSGFDTLSFVGRRTEGMGAGPVRLEVRRGKRKTSFKAFQGTRPDSRWRPVTWRYSRGQRSVSWGAPGRGQWRLRLAAPEPGVYRVVLRATDRTGASEECAHAVRLGKTSEHGFIRGARQCPRYLRYDSGEPFFSVGVNLLVFNHDFAEYLYYMDRFTEVGVNLFRVWLNNPCLGFEKHALVQYEPQACAVLDALVNGADRRGAALMLCLLDHRDVIEKKRLATGRWEKDPYHTVCKRAFEFFTDPGAKQAFRKRLRYLVARWGASPAVHSWEFFNEVEITDAWRREGMADAVRTWHAGMAAELRRLDPYDHLITTSRGGSQADPLWAQPLMEIVQPHCYQTASVDFATFMREPCMDLAQYGKPVVPGEFGLMTVKYEDVRDGGVSVHNGLWASVMIGCCGTAMPWWWKWIDRHGHYRHFKGVSEFVKGIRWHEEAFAPIPAERLAVAVPKERTSAPGPVSLKLARHTWDAAAPYNRPARVVVRADGLADPEGAVSTRLHGLRNHRDCHNPKTFVVDYPRPGRFVVGVDCVSGYGGADLRISLDGQQVLLKDFVDEDEQLKNVMRHYRGDYGVDVPKGRHEIQVVNRGADWIQLSQIRLENYGSTPRRLHVMGLAGKTTALLWLRNVDYTWFGRMARQPCRPVAGARLTLSGLPSGPCAVRFYAPRTASWLGERAAQVKQGRLVLSLPSVETDLAVAVNLRGAGPAHAGPG